MAQLGKNTFEGKFNSSSTGLFKTNTTKDIGSDDMRTMVEDLTDSFLNKTDEILDEDDMASNSAAAVPSQQSVKAYVDASGTTREFNRTWSNELLFDKNEIEYSQHTLTGNLEYTIAGSGHITNQFSSVVQRVVTDGTRTVTFTGFNFVLGDIQSGSIPDAGTYLVLFLYWNGVATVNWTKPSLEVANLTPLSVPANFAAVPGTDPETEIDLSWDTVANVSSYEIQYSVSGGAGPWIALTNPLAAATSYTHTGLTPATTYHYRIRAIGDMVAFSNSGYVTDAATTQDAGDITPPTFTFSPADAATDISMNGVMTITASAPLRDQDGVTAITNANLTDYITAVNSSAAAQPFTATIDVTKTIITITPNVVWTELDDITITIDGVESSVNGVHAVSDSATFTTNDYTLMNGNYSNLGTQFNSIITGVDKNFEFEYEFKGAVFVGRRGFWQYGTFEATRILFGSDEDDVFFWFSPGTNTSREVVWPNALTGITDGKIRAVYDGTVDTNNGLDRVDLYIDDVLITAGKNVIASGATAWPFGIGIAGFGTGALYISGPTIREVRNAFVRSNDGAVVEGSYPVIRTGEDVSGNNRDGTWL